MSPRCIAPPSACSMSTLFAPCCLRLSVALSTQRMTSAWSRHRLLSVETAHRVFLRAVASRAPPPRRAVRLAKLAAAARALPSHRAVVPPWSSFFSRQASMSRSTQRPAAWHHRCLKFHQRPSVDCYVPRLEGAGSSPSALTTTWHAIHLSLYASIEYVQSVMSFLYSVFLFF
jgi:hypothetical protein